ncbi:hypothetical protein RCL1_007244 [Eukaryota sp. TZLM3-RCL]
MEDSNTSHNDCLISGCVTKYSHFSDPNDDPRFSGFLGKGSQGSVRLVKHSSGLLYAEKSFLATSSSSRELLFLFNPLPCPYLVRFFHAFQDKNYIKLIMEYCPSGSLRRKMTSLDYNDCWIIFIQVLEALNTLHMNKIINRDVKPENILLMNEYPPYNIKVCDFGVSKFGHESIATTVIGSMAYIAPEVHARKGYSFEADFFSLGILLYEMSEKKLPKRAFVVDKKKLVFSEDSPFKRIIIGLLEVDPSKRFGYTDLLNLPEVVEARDLFHTISAIGGSLASDVSALHQKMDEMKQKYEETILQLENQIANLQSEIFLLKERDDEDVEISQFSSDEDSEEDTFSVIQTVTNDDLSFEFVYAGIVPQDPILDVDLDVWWGLVNDFDSVAYIQLGLRYERGVGVEMDKRKAYEMFQASAHDETNRHLGRCYLFGIGTPAEPHCVAEIFEDGLKLGDLGCYPSLAFCYIAGVGVEQDYDRAIELLQNGVSVGVKSCFEALAFCYDYGIGVDKISQRAEELRNEALLLP